MELSGTIIAILPAHSGISQRTGNQWMTQQYVLEIPGQYPRHMVFEVFGKDRIRQFNIQIQGQYNVSFDIDASEYQGKWYNKIKAYSVVALTKPASVAAQQPATPPVQHAASVSQPQPAQNESDDLPF